MKLFIVFTSLLVASSAVAGPAYPLKVSPGKHHVVDQNNVPFFIQGDSPWFLSQALNGADVDYYLSNRWAQGFNSIILNLTAQKYDDVQSYEGDIYGQLPFTNTIAGPFTNLLSWNERYFTNVDAVIRRAGHYGICVFAYPLYDSYNGATWYAQMAGNTTNAIFAYGQFIGQRYKNFTNIVWIGAGDYNEPNPPLWNWMAAGIRSADTNHLFTAQAARPIAAAYYSAFVTLNSTYGSQFPYIESLAAYQRTPIMPSFAREPYYEHRNITGTPYGALDCRRFAWWAVLSGDAGHFFGNEHQWPFAVGWQAEMWSTATTSMTNVIRLMNTRPWYDCIPDANHTIVTSGYGTWGSGNYVSVMREATGKTVIAYIPGYSMAPTVKMTKISGANANAWWYDPRTGNASGVATFATSGFLSFTPPDANDWVLVIDDASQNYGPPGQGTGSTLQIQPVNLAAGTVGVVYSVQLTASGGTGPYSWSVLSGTLPTGLTLSVSGLLTGTPSAVGTFNSTVRVTDSRSETADRALTISVTVQPNTAPTITSLGDRTINAGGNTGPIGFTVGDAETAAGGLTVSGSSSNPALVPNANLVFGGSGASRTLTVTPAAGQSGTATITVSVSDGLLTTSSNFLLTVNAGTPPAATAYVTGRVLGTLRNDFSGYVGMTIVVGSNPITVTALGRMMVSGNSGTHTVKLVKASDGTDVPGGAVSISMSGGTAGQFQYGTLSSPVTLTAGTAYYLMSQETEGGDTWYNYNTTVTTTGVATESSSVWGYGPGQWYTAGGASQTFGPVDFIYGSNAVANTPPTVSVIANRTINVNGNTGPIGFTVGDAETPVASLTVSGSSSNPTLVPNANLVFGGSGASRTLTITPAAGQSGIATITVSVSDGLLTTSSNFLLTVNVVNTAPVASITSPTTGTSVAFGTLVSFVGSATDAEDGNRTSSLTWTSSESGLIGTGGSFSAVLNPGTHTITAIATDAAGLTGNATISVTVQPNTAPTITSLGDRTINAGGNTGPIGFTVGDAETAAGGLTVSGSSSNPALVPNANLVFGGGGASRTLTVTPAAGQSGTATITVSVSDGLLTTSSNFLLTVNAGTPPAATAYVTGRVLGTLRNDFSGYVGMIIVVGSNPITVTTLGRMMVSGNSGTHTVKLIKASDGTDVPGGAVSIGMSGGTAGQFQYGTLSSAVTLAAGATYYVMSQETEGGDTWYNYNTTVTTTTVATQSAAVWGYGSGPWYPHGGAGQTFVPVDFKYESNVVANTPPTVSPIANRTINAGGNTGPIGFTVGDAETAAGGLTVSGSSSNPALVPNANLVFGGSGASRTLTVTPAAGQSGTATITVSVSDGLLTTSSNFLLTVNAGTPPAATAYVTGRVLGTLRNDFSGYVGMTIVVGSNPITVTALGRMMVSGNSGTHTVKLVKASDGTDVPGGAVSISMSGGTAGQFQYGTLSSPVTLTAGTAYYLMSQETEGGDTWYNYNTTVTTTTVATQSAAVWGYGSGPWYPHGGAGQTFVPVDFKYGSN